MKNYNVDLSPNLVNLGTEGSLDTSVLNGKSLQRTVNLYNVYDENNNVKVMTQQKDGNSFNNIVPIVDDLSQNYIWEDRPSQWLTLPDVRTSDKFVGLVAIYPDSNFLAFTVEGDYTVDWGDGTIENFGSGDTAERQYNYDDISSEGESELGYRQVIVQITPQEGNSLTSIDLAVDHSQVGLGNYQHPWLEVNLNAPKLTNLHINASTNYQRWQYLKSFTLFANSLTDMSYMLQNTGLVFAQILNCSKVTTMQGMFRTNYNLLSVNLFNTENVTDMSHMFEACTALETAPSFDTSNATDMNNMFNSCYVLQSVPSYDTKNVTDMNYMFAYCFALTTVQLFDTNKVTDMSSMFEECYALQSVPLFDTKNVTDMNHMFYYCFALTTVPLFNTRNVTNMVRMFDNCYALQSVPLFDTRNVTNMVRMLAYCSSLTSVPLFDTSNVTNMSQMLWNCISLQTVPLFDTSNVTNMSGMFVACIPLQSVPLFDTSNVTNMSSMFDGCILLSKIPPFDMSNVTNTSGMFNYCANLSVGTLNGTEVNISYANCKLSDDRLNEIYTNLATVVDKTITVTGNWGTGDDTPSIATNKGWTVTG